MLKFSVSNVKLFLFLQSIPIFHHFFVFYLPALDHIKDDIIRGRIFSALRYGDVTGKFTVENRFSDIDEKTVHLLSSPFEMHDVAVSSGVTSLNLLDEITKSGKRGCLTISDKFSEMYVQGNILTRVYDADKKLRTIYFFGILFDQNLSKIFFLSKNLFKPLSFLKIGGDLKHLFILSYSVINAIKEKRIHYTRFDVFSGPTEKKYTFIRCMNLLNSCYFNNEQIAAAVANLRDSLIEGGILLLGRTIDTDKNRASFYRKEGKKLYLMSEKNGGAEIHSIVESLNIDFVAQKKSAVL